MFPSMCRRPPWIRRSPVLDDARTFPMASTLRSVPLSSSLSAVTVRLLSKRACAREARRSLRSVLRSRAPCSTRSEWLSRTACSLPSPRSPTGVPSRRRPRPARVATCRLRPRPQGFAPLESPFRARDVSVRARSMLPWASLRSSRPEVPRGASNQVIAVTSKNTSEDLLSR